MTQKQIEEEIQFEDSCKCNDLLQQILNLNHNKIEYNVFMNTDTND